MFSDSLRKYWKWILAIIVLLFMLIINFWLFIITVIIIIIIYVMLKIRKNRKEGETQKVRLGVSHEVTEEVSIRENKICLSVGLGRSAVMIGNKWVAMLNLDYVDSSIINDIINLGDLFLGNGKHYLLIRGYDLNDVMIRLNTAVRLLISKNLPFRQLSPSEIINEVVGTWMK